MGAPGKTGRAENLVVCLSNEGYELDLKLGGLYEVVPDESLEADDILVIDETGEDYIYPASYFSSDRQVMHPPKPEIYSDIAREAYRFIEENQPLLSKGSPTVLGRVYVQGANIFTTFSEEFVEVTNRAAAAKNALADAINNPTTPPRRLQELEEEEARVSKVYEAHAAASGELHEFLQRVKALLPEQGMDEGE